MKTTIKSLSLAALVVVSLNAGLAQADNASCLFGSAAPAAAPRVDNSGVGAGMMSAMEARMNQQMERIEQGLRNGQLSPELAGKLMREQWEAMQFQRGFMSGNRQQGMDRVAGGGDSCGLKQDAKEIAAKIAPVVGNLAVEGMQTATTVMRAIARGADKLIREEAPQGDWF
jgi:hypothetical protein